LLAGCRRERLEGTRLHRQQLEPSLNRALDLLEHAGENYAAAPSVVHPSAEPSCLRAAMADDDVLCADFAELSARCATTTAPPANLRKMPERRTRTKERTCVHQDTGSHLGSPGAGVDKLTQVRRAGTQRRSWCYIGRINGEPASAYDAGLGGGD